jgi:F0F1-type ATP synthase membrane subunit b/b'
VNSFVTLLQSTATEVGTTVVPKAAEPILLDLDSTVFVMLGLFLLLLLILWQFLWKPYLRARDERVARVEGAREEAAKLDAEAAARLARIDSALTEARRNGTAEMAKLRLAAQVQEQKIVAEAQAAGRAMLTESRAKLEATVATEKANLKAHTGTLARVIAEKTLGRRLAS